MLATSLTAALLGVEAHLVTVEADSAPGFPRFTMVGLADSALKESESRIRAALRNCGIPFQWDRRITVNLAPASLRKGGSSFDLATALGLLAADATLQLPQLARVLLVGELALDGSLRPVPGVLPMLLLARRQGLAAAIVPAASSREAALAPGLPVFPVATLAEAIGLLSAEELPPPPALVAGSGRRRPAARSTWPTCADRRWRVARSRSPPPAATTCCWSARPAPARRCWRSGCPASCPRSPTPRPSRPRRSTRPPACPPRTPSRGGPSAARTTRRPARRSWAAASGRARGKSAWPTTGCSFLDELAEFRRGTLEVLRQPLEDGYVTVVRHRGVCRMPARFQLVAALNPCPVRLCRDGPGGLSLHAWRHPGLPRPAVGPPARSDRPARRRPGAQLRRDRRTRRRIDRGRPVPGHRRPSPAGRDAPKAPTPRVQTLFCRRARSGHWCGPGPTASGCSGTRSIASGSRRGASTGSCVWHGRSRI